MNNDQNIGCVLIGSLIAGIALIFLGASSTEATAIVAIVVLFLVIGSGALDRKGGDN